MSLQQKLIEAISNKKISHMGIFIQINCPKSKQFLAATRLYDILHDEFLGLTFNPADYKTTISNREFITIVCDFLEINLSEYQAELALLQKEGDRIASMYQPWLFANTNFERASESLFLLSACEVNSKIYFSKHIQDLPYSELLNFLEIEIKTHYKKHKNGLPILGDIQNYKYFYADKKSLIFNTDGNLIDSNANDLLPPDYNHLLNLSYNRK